MTTTNHRPTHELIHTIKRGKKSYSTRIGAAWARDDGSLAIEQDYLPAKPGGFLNLRPIRSEEDGEGA